MNQNANWPKKRWERGGQAPKTSLEFDCKFGFKFFNQARVGQRSAGMDGLRGERGSNWGPAAKTWQELNLFLEILRWFSFRQPKHGVRAFLMVLLPHCSALI